MKIVQTMEYDITLSYSWSTMQQGMCGHLFECIEYFYLLKDHFSVCIFIGEEIGLTYIEETIRDKYTFTEEEIQEIISSIIIQPNPSILKGNNLLFTDAGFGKMENKSLLFKNIMAFPCADMTFKTMPKVHVFQDDRIYGKSEAKTYHYIKKILLSKYKPLNKSVKNVNMIYATKNARGLDESFYPELEKLYSGDFLLLTNTPIKSKLSERFKQEEMPVKNLMEKFSTYIYTPVGKKFDCSPRFLVECKYYGKDVIFHDIDYWDIDLGLKYRVQDIDDHFNSLILEKDDSIIDLIKGVIWKTNIV